MAKPWARLEQNYINHPKFLALDATAICLWHEGKNYCDMHQTDGLIPREALKTFRFAGRKQIDALIASCGQKPSGEPWAPLWESSGSVGFKMHDYLDHNDCRDAVLDRIQDAEDVASIRKAANAERQRKFRAERKKRLEAIQRNDHNALRHAVSNVTSRTPTETETETKEQEREARNATSALRPSRAEGRSDGVMDGQLPKNHREHITCNDTWTVCVPPAVHAKLKNSLAGRYAGDRGKADDALRAWYPTVFQSLPVDFVMGDAFRFWQVKFDAELASKAPTAPKRDEPTFTVPDADETRRRLRENRS